MTRSTAGSNNSMLPPPWVITVFLGGALIWLLTALKELVILLIVGFAIAYVIEPVIRVLERRKIRRVWAFFLVFLAFIVLISALLLTTWPTLVREGSNLIQNLPGYIEKAQEQTALLLRDHVDSDSSLGKFISAPFERLQDFGANILPRALSGLQTVLLSGYSVTLTVLNLTLLPFIVFYLTMSFPNLRQGFLNLIPRSKRNTVSSILTQINTQVAAFVRGQLLVATILFLLFALGLGLMGIELWLVLAVIAGFGNLIPYVGTILGVVLCSVMAVVTFGDFWHVLYVWILFAVVQFLEGSFITPRIQGESVGLHPLIIILAIVAFGSLFGLLGVMLAVPAAAALRVLLNHGHGWWIQRVDN